MLVQACRHEFRPQSPLWSRHGCTNLQSQRSYIKMGAGDGEFQKLAGHFSLAHAVANNLNKVIGEYRCLRLSFNLYTHTHICHDTHVPNTQNSKLDFDHKCLLEFLCETY